jgi:hypothetical protein
MYIVGADSAFDHDLEKALFNIKCNTLLLLLLLLSNSNLSFDISCFTKWRNQSKPKRKKGTTVLEKLKDEVIYNEILNVMKGNYLH